jgi:phage repressor protein C with HTH and peptisase S24 domain
MQIRQRSIFSTVKTEGSILPVDLLQRIAEGKRDLDGLDPESYHLDRGERLNEAINRSWNRLIGAWSSFKHAAEKLPDTDTGTQLTRERWLLPLFRELGYGRLLPSKAFELNDKSYPISHVWNHTPIHLVGAKIDLDRKTAGIRGAAGRSPHGLVQEFLNRSDDHLWGFVSDGYHLRVLRDNISITRQAYVEFDLEAMMDGEVYSDFALLWLLCHESRVESTKPEECWLEKWSKEAQQQGTRALDQLRDGVESAIATLGQGFLAHRANDILRAKLKSGELDKQTYYHQLLRIVYRLLFLFVAEDRDLLLDPNTSQEARDRYTQFYSTARLRRLAGRHRGSRHSDLFFSLKLVMAKLGNDKGCPELGLPVLGGFLFSNNATPDIDECEIQNSDLIESIRALAFTKYNNARRPVNYKNLGPEEFGSVYESLLELHPDLSVEAAAFKLDTTSGNERKTTGSYYTPTSLITSLLDTALDPVVNEARKKNDPEKAILDLKVCDPACGSGHFLIAAAHRIAKHLAAARTGDEEPSPKAQQAALRDVISHCIYGVDINPMAVELCKVNLWMESLEPGKPLSFLDHHIQCGNSLLGATPALIAKGIPDAAFTAIEGDDKPTCAKYKKSNKHYRETKQDSLFDDSYEVWPKLDNVAAKLAKIELIPDDSIEEVQHKQRQYELLIESSDYKNEYLLANAWCSAFLWRKVETKTLPYPITEETIRKIERDPFSMPEWMKSEIKQIAAQYKLFHWHLAFPDVFMRSSNGETTENHQVGWSGGFDVVLGNPPWERIKLQEKEWFASRNPEIADAPNAAARRRIINALKDEDPALYEAFLDAKRQAEGESHLIRNSDRFPLCGRGDINTYAIFAEIKRSILSATGRVGCIVPSGVATDDTTKYFFQDLMDRQSLASLYDFENREAIFQGVHRSYKFCLLTLTGFKRPASHGADFVFFALNTNDLHDDWRRFTLSAEDIELLNPNTRTCPIFRSKRDAELTKSIYRRVPVLIKEGPPEENPWGIKFLRMFDMANDSNLFRTREQLENSGWVLDSNVFISDDEKYLPLYEAKMLHHFDHRWATYEGTETRDITLSEKKNPNFVVMPRYWVPEAEVENRLHYKWDKDWLLGWRDICRSTDERTVIAGIVPISGCADTFLLLFPDENHYAKKMLIIACLNSFILDYSARQKVGGMHIKYNIFKQLPMIPPYRYDLPAEWLKGGDMTGWLTTRITELSCTAWDIESTMNNSSSGILPFHWNEERRFLLRCELDAAYFHLYGIARDDVDYIMETFPIVKRKDEARYGEFRTKKVILDIYDAMTKAMEVGQLYQTLLDPPPADPRIAHQQKANLEQQIVAKTVQDAAVEKTPEESETVLPFRRVEKPIESEKFNTIVPLYTLQAVAGGFSDVQDVEFDSWVEMSNITRKLTTGMFVAKVDGKSMEPRIPDGSYCLFYKPVLGTREDKIVLAQHHSIDDPETGGSYTVKLYRNEKVYDKFGNWQHSEIRLEPINPDYEPLVFPDAEEGELRIIAEFVDVL